MKSRLYKAVTFMFASIIIIIIISIIYVHVFYPKYFDGIAKKTIENEVEIVRKQQYNETVPKPQEKGYEGFFNSELSKVYLYDNYECVEYTIFSTFRKQEVYQKIKQYINEENLKDETLYCYSKEKNENYAFYFYVIDLESPLEDHPDATKVLIYIDYFYVYKIINLLTIAIITPLSIVVVMVSILGLLLGKKSEQNRGKINEFFQNTSHELKTPLMSIQSYAEGIQLGIVDTKEGSEVILQESERMSNLVNEILKLSKIDSKQLILHIHIIDLKEILYQCVFRFDPIMKQKNLQFEVDIPTTMVLVEVDELQIIQAVSNIITNKIRYAKTKIVMSCYKELNSAYLKITGDGEKLSEDEIEKIFERFHSGQNGQTGLGLSVTKGILDLHKAKIKVYNEEGLTFLIKFKCIPKFKRRGRTKEKEIK